MTLTHHPFRPFYLHQWLDVRDPFGKWYEAQIIALDGTRIRVHYFRWKSKYDELLAVAEHDNANTQCGRDADRVAPLHTHTACPPAPMRDLPAQINVGQKLMVRDSLDNWEQAVVLDMDPAHDMVLVRYLDWSVRWNEWINADSYRLGNVLRNP